MKHIYGYVSVVVGGLLIGIIVTLFIGYHSSIITYMCYDRGGVIKIPVATIRDSHNKSKPVWAMYTTFNEKQYYLWEIGIEKDGPRMYQKYRSPVYILDERMLDKLKGEIVQVEIFNKVKEKKGTRNDNKKGKKKKK